MTLKVPFLLGETQNCNEGLITGNVRWVWSVAMWWLKFRCGLVTEFLSLPSLANCWGRCSHFRSLLQKAHRQPCRAGPFGLKWGLCRYYLPLTTSVAEFCRACLSDILSPCRCWLLHTVFNLEASGIVLEVSVSMSHWHLGRSRNTSVCSVEPPFY